MRRREEVFVFVRRGDEYLVLHRSPRGGAYWHGVAGALEEGEGYAEAARRELFEETGLDAEPRQVGAPSAYRVEHDPRFHRLRPWKAEVLVQAFLVEVQEGWEPELDHEHDDYRWCLREEALELLHWPETRQSLRALPPA